MQYCASLLQLIRLSDRIGISAKTNKFFGRRAEKKCCQGDNKQIFGKSVTALEFAAGDRGNAFCPITSFAGIAGGEIRLLTETLERCVVAGWTPLLLLLVGRSVRAVECLAMKMGSRSAPPLQWFVCVWLLCSPFCAPATERTQRGVNAK